MGILFLKADSGLCCLCNNTEMLTREHKLKKSELKRIFTDHAMAVIEGSTNRKRIAQGPNSMNLTFEPRLCRQCNSERSQPADKEFETLNSLAQDLVSQGKDPSAVFDSSRYKKGSEGYYNAFRYFAKLLCCHIAQDNGPSPRRLAHFSISNSTHNPIWLQIKKSVKYEKNKGKIGDHNYAAHGGLVIWSDRKTLNPTRFISSVSFGPVQYLFWMELAKLEQLELRFLYKEYYQFCQKQIGAAIKKPIAEDDLENFGL